MLTLKDFKVGDAAYLIKEERGRNTEPTITKTTVKKVGHKYVTTDGYFERRYMEFDACYLVEEVSCGDRTILFRTEQEAKNYLEGEKLASWLGCIGVYRAKKYSLSQLKRVKQVLDNAAGNFIAINEKEHVLISVCADNLNEACQKAQNYFERTTGNINHIVVIEIPEDIITI